MLVGNAFQNFTPAVVIVLEVYEWAFRIWKKFCFVTLWMHCECENWNKKIVGNILFCNFPLILQLLICTYRLFQKN